MRKLSSIGKRRTFALLVSLNLGIGAALIGYAHVATASGIPKPPRYELHPEELGIKLGPGEYIPPIIHSVPIDCLITTPEKYDGMLIMTSGYVVFDSETICIFPHKEDYDNDLPGNCIGLHQKQTGELDIDVEGVQDRGPIDSRDKVQKCYCIVEGIFDAKDNGHFRWTQGSIGQLDRLQFWSDPSHPNNRFGARKK